MNEVLKSIERWPLPRLRLDRREVLIDNLLFIHGLIVASESLFEQAIERLSFGSLRQYYMDHLKEERGHSRWLAKDLGQAGITPTAIDWTAAQIAGAQYYLIHHVSPQALLGYLAALECRPMPLDQVATLEELHGKELLRTCRYHAEHDIEHGPQVLDFIETLPDANMDLIAANAEWTARSLQLALNSLSILED